MSALDTRMAPRMGGASRPDAKGYAEKKAEIFYHVGLCQSRDSAIRNGLNEAIVSWRRAKIEIGEAWGSQATRAWEGQYWIHHPVPIPGGRSTIAALVEGTSP